MLVGNIFLFYCLATTVIIKTIVSLIYFDIRRPDDGSLFEYCYSDLYYIRFILGFYSIQVSCNKSNGVTTLSIISNRESVLEISIRFEALLFLKRKNKLFRTMPITSLTITNRLKYRFKLILNPLTSKEYLTQGYQVNRSPVS